MSYFLANTITYNEPIKTSNTKNKPQRKPMAIQILYLYHQQYIVENKTLLPNLHKFSIELQMHKSYLQIISYTPQYTKGNNMPKLNSTPIQPTIEHNPKPPSSIMPSYTNKPPLKYPLNYSYYAS